MFPSKLNTLDESFQPIVQAILDQLTVKGWEPVVAEGRRSSADENEKVREGYSKTRHSYHILGLAADIVDQRYGWNIPLEHEYWWDLYLCVCSVDAKLTQGYLRSGLDWDEDGRAAFYSRVLDKVKSNQESAEDGSKEISWFCDVAHVEYHYN